MSATVRLRIYSTLDDPQWTLEDWQEQHVKQWLDTAQRRGITPPAESDDDLPTSGYRGFQVNIDTRPPVLVYHRAAIEPRSTSDEPIDRFLFGTNRQRLEDEHGLDISLIDGHGPEQIEGMGPTSCADVSNCGPTFPGSGSAWDETSNRANNNCYNYANNVMTNRVVFPGDSRSGFLNADDLTHLLDRDGLHFLGKTLPRSCPLDRRDHYIAAVLNTIGRRGDYHFFRLDDSGRWSQKQSLDRITDRDDRSPRHQIDDLCGAQFNVQRVFVGFFVSTERARQRLIGRGGGLAS